MKRLKLTTASAASAVVLLACGLSGAVCKSRGHFSGVGFDFSTGGYHDVAVIVSPELSRAECPQILDDVKVSSLGAEIWGCAQWMSDTRIIIYNGHLRMSLVVAGR